MEVELEECSIFNTNVNYLVYFYINNMFYNFRVWFLRKSDYKLICMIL